MSFLGEGGGLSTKIETSASAFRGRGVTEILLIVDACGWGREGDQIFGHFMWTS